MKNILYLYAIELVNETVGLVSAASLSAARLRALRQQGTANVRRVRPATAQDVSWIRGMGGYVPCGRVQTKRRRHEDEVNSAITL